MRLDIRLKNGQELQLNESFLTSFRYADMVTNAEEIRIGVAPSATLDFNVINRDNVLSGKKFEDCQLVYYNDKGEKKGTFDCSEIKKNKKSIDFEMVDKMMKFEVDWKGCAFPTTTYNLLLNICNQCGISLRTLKSDIINADLTIQEEDGLAGETCRTILKYLCEVFGSYANMDENGDLLIEYYDFNTIKDQIKYGQCTYFEIDEKVSRRAGILFKNNKENIQIGDTSSSYIIEDNPIIRQLSESVKKEVGQRIVDRIKYTSLKSGEFTLAKRDLKEGDVIEVVEENGDISVCVVSKIVFENLNKMTIFSYGDTKNTKESTSTSTSSRTTDSETYSSEVYLGRGQNHQKVVAKGGTYTLVEKLITNITSFSKVNLNLFVNFNYNLDKILFFDIYANDKLVKSLKYEATQGFNQFSVGFLADIDFEQTNNLYSCKITLEDGDVLEIDPFECQISFIVKSCKITDAVAVDQYFVEKYNKIDNCIFNQNRFTIKTLRERVTIKIPFYTFDVSKNGDGSVIADWYENGDLEISGNGETQDNLISEIARGKFGGWNSQGTAAQNALKNETTRMYVYGDIVLGEKFLKDTINLEEVHFNGNIKVKKECFLNCTKLTTLTGEQGIYYVGVSAFNGCNLTGTLDLSNCIEFNDYSFYNNSNINYIYFPRPIVKSANSGMEHCFDGCVNLDGIVVMDSANSGNPHSTSFQNTRISTFMFMADVEYKPTAFLKNIATPNPTLYVCLDWDDGSTWDDINSKTTIYELEEDYGFTIIFYEKEQEQEILNSLGV